MQKVVITGHDLTVDQIIAVCREGAEVVLSDESREKILASRQVVNELVEERRSYTGSPLASVSSAMWSFPRMSASCCRRT